MSMNRIGGQTEATVVVSSMSSSALFSLFIFHLQTKNWLAVQASKDIHPFFVHPFPCENSRGVSVVPVTFYSGFSWLPSFLLCMALSLVCRGDIPFCTEECRREQMEMDEEMERKENSNPKKVAARAPSHAGVESPPRPPKARAGSILAG